MPNLNLTNMIERNEFKRGNPKKLMIDGVSKDYETYLIPIEYLYLNDLNGRISTFILEYNDRNSCNLQDLLEEDREKYNDKIADFIKKSANDRFASFKKTKQDIKEKTQQVAGVVLSDGRIIDGNRRFTAIRELYNEGAGAQFNYFEAACLPAPDKDDIKGWQRIKALELYLQYNVDDKRDYDPIDALVSFYTDTMEGPDKITKKDYCYASGMKPGEYDKNIRIINIMIDYLEWRNKPKCFHIIKQEKLDGPIKEIANKIKHLTDTEWNNKKFLIYSYMTLVKTGDKTRDIRKLINSAVGETTLYNELNNSLDSSFYARVDEAVTGLSKVPESAEESNKINSLCKDLQNELTSAFTDASYSDEVKAIQNKPAQTLSKILINLSSIKAEEITNLDIDEKNKLIGILDDIKSYIDKINKCCNDENS